jgi:hypothetical protein
MWSRDKDIDNIPKMSMEHLLLERENASGWYAKALDEEIALRNKKAKSQTAGSPKP